MSQVRKFKDGGGTAAQSEQQSSTEAKKKYRLIINGQERLLDDEGLAAFRKAGSGQGGMMGNVYADIADALQAGNTVSYNSDSNTISGVNFKRIDPTVLAKARENQTWDRKAQRRANRYARKNNLTHQFNEALASIGNINFYKPEDKTTGSPDSLTSLYATDPRRFDYNKGEDGKLTWSTGPQNAGNLTALNNFIDMLGMSEEDAKKKYSWSGYDDQIRDLRNWYSGNQNYDWEGLRSRIRGNQLTEDDWDVLRYMGFGENETSQQDSADQNGPRSYEGSGFNNDALEQAGYYVHKDSNGNPVLYDNNGQVVRDSIYLKDFAWASDSPWKNGAWYQGKFYTNDELLHQDNDANRAFQAYVNASTVRDENGNFNPELYRQALNQTEWIYAGRDNSNPYTKYQDPSKTLLPGFEHITNPYYFQDISSEFTTPEETTIISYLDPTNLNNDGSPTVKYAVSGNPNAIFDSQEKLQTYLSGLPTPISRVTGIRTPRPQIFQPEYESDGKQRYLKSKIAAKVQNEDGSIQDQSVYKGNDGSYYFKGQNGKFYLISGTKIMDKIRNQTPITQKEFEYGMDESDKMSWFRRNIIGGNMEVGMNPYFNPKSSKYTENQYDDILGFKKGGTIPILQFGGIVARNQSSINRGAESEGTIGTLHKVGGGPGLTDASDKWGTAATVLDTASLGTSFIPGVGNIVGALTGLGGSVSRFVSDIKRDGFDAGDLGRFGINLGLDALTLIPFAGSAAKAAKLAKAGKATVKAAKNTAKVTKAADKTKDILSSSDVIGNIAGIGKLFKPGEKIRKAGRAAEIVLPAIGTASGIESAINATRDGEITTDEMASIASGIMSTALLGRGISRALDRKALKALQDKIGIKSIAPEYKASFKKADGTDVSVKLSADDLNELKNKKSKKSLIDTLETKVKNQGVDLEKTGIKAEDLLDRFGLQLKDGFLSGLNKNWNRLNVPKDKKLDVFSTEALSSKKLAKKLQGKNLGYWDNRAARAYQYGLSRDANALRNIERFTGKSIYATPRTTFGGWGLEWDLSPALKRATVTRTGRQMISKMYHSRINDLASAKRYVATNLSPDKQAYWMDLLNTRGKEFDDLFKKLSTLTGDAAGRIRAIDSFEFKQGGKIIKAQPGTKFPYGKFVTDNSSTDPNLFNYQRSGIQFNGSNVDWTKTYGKGKFTDLRNYYLNNWGTEAFKPVQDAYLAQLSTGNSNVDLSNFTKDDFTRLTQDQKLGYAHNLWTDQLRTHLYNTGDIFKISGMNINDNDTFVSYLNPDGSKMTMQQTYNYLLKKGVPEDQVKAYVSKWAGNFANSYDGTELDAAAVTTSPASTPTNESTVTNEKLTDGSNIGQSKQRRGFNWDPDTFIGLGNLAYSVHKNNQMYGVLDDAIRTAGRALQKQMPTEIYDRYQDHITPIYQEAANAKRQFTPTSTDAILNYTMRQQNEDAAQQLLTEGRLKASEAYSQYLDKNLAARRAYTDQRREVADQNRAIKANTVMQLGQNDAARRLANNQSVQNYVMEFRNKLAQDKAKRDNLIQSYYTTKAQNDYNTAFRNYLSDVDGKNYYQLFKEATDKAPNETFEDWLYRTDMNVYNKANEAGIAAAGETRWNGAASALNWFRVPDYPGLASTTPSSPYGVPLAKRGGKTPKYMQRHTGQKPDEAIWIQRNKDTAKALEKLHDAVIKLFMKTLS